MKNKACPAGSGSRFSAEYARLNPRQKEAVEAIEGPVMVVAGPGTGKTQILSLRIANILNKTDTAPDSVLALTFTESGAHSMRKRLIEMIGESAYRVHIYTFHGFCNQVIKDFPEEFPRIIGSRNVSDMDRKKLMEKLLDDPKLEKLRPSGDPLYYVKSAISTITSMKRENVSPEDFEKILKKERKEFENISDLYHEKGAHKGKMKGEYADWLKHLEKNGELLLVYQNYEKALAKGKLYDYEDMIMEVVRMLEKNSDLLLRLQEEYQYILVDEHQDTNEAQNKVLELLSGFHESPNLFVVGDEKQAIFRFQGASLGNFMYFQKKYKGSKLIYLDDNYRSTQTILDYAHSLMGRGGSEIRKKLKANVKHKNNKIELYVFSKTAYEPKFLADSIKNKIKDGVLPAEIAVIYRDNGDAFPIADALERAGIPFVIESNENILDDEDMRKLVAILRMVNNFGEGRAFLEALHIDFLGIDEFSIYKLNAFAKKNKKDVFEIARDGKLLKTAVGVGAEEISKVYEKFSSWAKLARNKSLSEFFEIMVRESGLLENLLKKENALEKLDRLEAVFDELKGAVGNHKDFNLEDFLSYIDSAKEDKTGFKTGGKRASPDRVRLMTAHRSKGLEFEVVFVSGLFDGHWGNKRNRSYFRLPKACLGGFCEEGGENDDERRLLYVAITRAKKEVILSYGKEDEDGRALLPSQFLEEMDKGLLEQQNVADLEAKFEKNKAGIFNKKIIIGSEIKDKKFLNELFTERGLSPTALNHYLKCPWKFFYETLIRLPHLPNKNLMFGNVVHDTLKIFFDRLKEGNEMSKNEFLDLFEKKMNLETFEENDFQAFLKKGKKILSGYYDEYIDSWNRNILNEFPVTIDFNGIKLTGKIDKIEFLDDKRVNVVDYKTGKPKNRDKIEGKTKDSDGDYKRQLTFYKLLLNGYENGKWDVISGEIDFIEPSDSGKYKKEVFVITEKEVAELKEVIKKVAKEILALSFWNKKCGDKDCEYCRLRDFL